MTTTPNQPEPNTGTPAINPATPTAPGAPVDPAAPVPTKPKRKLELDVNDIDTVLERKISP